tara:strand:- start:258 stop:647 length:390 start_codon:yes stop_codon:yes gene_type:complete
LLSYPKKIVLLQIQALIAGSLVSLFLADFVFAKEFVLGALIAILPQTMFFLIFINLLDLNITVFSYSRIYFAELLKLLSSALGFIVVFKIVVPENPLIVFFGFFTVYLLQLSTVFFLGQSVFRPSRLEG